MQSGAGWEAPARPGRAELRRRGRGLEPAGPRWGVACASAPCAPSAGRGAWPRVAPAWPRDQHGGGGCPPSFRGAPPAEGVPLTVGPWTPAWEAALYPALDMCAPCVLCHVDAQRCAGWGPPGAGAWGPPLRPGVMGRCCGPSSRGTARAAASGAQ